jgi:hypothetical protein
MTQRSYVMWLASMKQNRAGTYGGGHKSDYLQRYLVIELVWMPASDG